MDKPIGLLIGPAIIAGVVLSWSGILIVGMLSMGWMLARGRSWIVPGLACVAVAVIGSGIANRASDEHSAGDLEASDRATGDIVSMPVSRPSGDRALFRVTSLHEDDRWSGASGTVLLYLPANSGVSIGDRIRVSWKPTPLQHLPPGRAGFIRSQGAIASASVFAVTTESIGTTPLRWLVSLRRSITDRFLSLDTGDTGALMSGLVTGDDSGLSDSARGAFATTGTGHITAVSGTNVALLAAFWYRWLSRGRRTRRWVAPGVIATIWTYSAMTGLEPSAVRAAAVATLVVLAGYTGRRADPVTSLVLVTAALLLIRPEWQYSVGFWLSSAAAGALSWHMRMDVAEGALASIKRTAMALFMAQLATLPIIAWTFGVVTPGGILANLALTPIMAIAFPLTFLFAPIAFVPGVANLLIVIPAAPNDVAIGVVTRLAQISPVWQLQLTSPLALFLVAVPCFAVISVTSTDAIRWMKRWQVARCAPVSR